MSEENFDAVDWINKTLKKSDDQQNKEVFKIAFYLTKFDDFHGEFAFLGCCLVIGVEVAAVRATSKLCSGRN